jgi:hypothetical protein
MPRVFRSLLPVLLLLVPAAPAAAASVLGKDSGRRAGKLAPSRVLAVRTVARADATITGIRVLVARGSRAHRLSVALYSSRRGKPARRLAVGSRARLAAGSRNVVALPPRRVLAGRRYWLAVLARGGTLRSKRPQGRCHAVARRGRRLPKRWRGGVRAACGVTLVARTRSATPPGAPPGPGPGGGLPAPTAGLPPGAALRAPGRAAVDAAIAAPFIRHGRRFTGGADTNEGFGGGSPMVLAAAAYAGDASADSRLLAQIRDTIAGGNEPVANGGYPAQHERWVTGMFAVVRHTPRIWERLSDSERLRIDLLIRGALIASAFTTSDSNPYLVAGTQQYTLDGEDNVNRDWNPNWREGMVGMMLVGSAYFGGGAGAHAVLESYQPASFLAELRAAGFTNMAETFAWKAENPGSDAPDPAAIAAAVRGYRYYGFSLTQPMEILWKLTEDTFQKRVNCGLNGGAGVNSSQGPAGLIVTDCAGLPNQGALGMLKEFDTTDGGGKRSSAWYAYDSYRVNLVNQHVMLSGGLWQPGDRANAVVARLGVGSTDLWYKLAKGYREYAKGDAMSVPGGGYVFRDDNADFAFPFARALWVDVIRPYHGL